MCEPKFCFFYHFSLHGQSQIPLRIAYDDQFTFLFQFQCVRVEVKCRSSKKKAERGREKDAPFHFVCKARKISFLKEEKESFVWRKREIMNARRVGVPSTY